MNGATEPDGGQPTGERCGERFICGIDRILDASVCGCAPPFLDDHHYLAGKRRCYYSTRAPCRG